MDTDSLFYRLASGYFVCSIENIFYKIYSPNISLKQKGHALYLSTIEDNKFDTKSWITQDMVDNLLKIYNIWNKDLQDQYDSLLKNIDNAKIELYLKYRDIKNRDKIKKLILDLYKKTNDLYSKKNYFNYLTLEYYSNSLRNQFLVMNCTYTSDNIRVFGDDLESVDTKLLEAILIEMYNNQIIPEDIKKLAHCDVWRSYWDASKGLVFGGSCIDWTDDQRALVNYSKTLDSIREHTECPDDDVLKDDLALDGWILYQKDKISKEKKKQEIIDKVGDTGNKHHKNNKDYINETFIITNDSNEAKDIFSLNDMTTRHDILATQKIVSEKGSLPWSEAMHFKRHINTELNRKAKEQRK